MALPTPDQAPLAELEYEPSAFEKALEKHKSKIILVSVIAGLGVAGYYASKLWSEHRLAKSGAAFYQAQSLEDYRRLAQAESGNQVGGNAMLMAAQILSEDGKPEEAIKELQTFLKTYADHPLADLAALRLADAHLLLGKPEEAKQSFLKMATDYPKSPHAPLALLRLADTYAAEKNKDEANKYYDQLRDKYPGNDYLKQGLAHRDALALKEPTIVPFVPEPPPAPPTPGAPNTPGTAPSTELSVPGLSLDGSTPAASGTPLEAPKLEAPVVPSPESSATPAPTPAAPVTPAPATPAAPTEPKSN
jgi:predicted negative regulator of RcsB-dependent stress response